MAQETGERKFIEVSGPVHYARVYPDVYGETHFSDEVLTFQLIDYAPPAPPISVSKVFEAENVSWRQAESAGLACLYSRPNTRGFPLVLAGMASKATASAHASTSTLGQALEVAGVTAARCLEAHPGQAHGTTGGGEQGRPRRGS